MWKVVKRIEFCYGHRLLNYEGKCKHPHGHNAVVEIECEGSGCDVRGMLVDFGDIKDAVKTYIDENWDHAMLLHRTDPLVEEYKKRGEPVFLFDENPTAETFAKHLFQIAHEKGLPVSEVRFWETPSSYAAYRA